MQKASESYYICLGMEWVSYPVLNLGFVILGLTPGQVGFDLFEVPITMKIFSHYVFANYNAFYHMNSLHLKKYQYN